MNISQTLISWYQLNKRDLPWRSTHDPYCICLSEVILQQTRVNQGLEYYNRFVERFPDVFFLAAATEEEVLKLWQGLGYYSRARNLHHAAHMIVQKFNGVFPPTYAELLKLNGIGEYTAAAISSIAYGEVKPVLDGNVARVLSRLYALQEQVDSAAGKKLLNGIASQLIDPADPATFNQAIMEFGALLCTPRNPGCETCPLQSSCLAFSLKRVNDYPVKLARTVVKERYFYYLVVTFVKQGELHLLLNHRNSIGIWRKMYDFPLLESPGELEYPAVLSAQPASIILNDMPFEISAISDEYIHILSHRKLITRFFKIKLQRQPESIQPYIAVPVSQIGKYPIPRLIDRYIRAEKLLVPGYTL